MDKDVEAKLNKLCIHYLNTQAQLTLLRPTKAPSGRAQRRGEIKVVDLLSSLGDTRKPQTAALVRLAYVRAMRLVDSRSRVSEDREGEVAFLTDRLNQQLGTIEARALLDHRRYVRRLILAKTFGNRQAAAHLESTGAPMALEQRARACVHSIIRAAEMAGTLAATKSGDYDEVVNA